MCYYWQWREDNIIGSIFCNPNIRSPPVTPDTTQGSIPSVPAVLPLSYSYCISLLCACLISPSYHLYLFYQTRDHTTTPGTEVWNIFTLHFYSNLASENSANLFATSDRGLLKTCTSEPQIERDHHLVRICYSGANTWQQRPTVSLSKGIVLSLVWQE